MGVNLLVGFAASVALESGEFYPHLHFLWFSPRSHHERPEREAEFGYTERLATHQALQMPDVWQALRCRGMEERAEMRSEEHTSELQSRLHLVCRLLLEKKKKGYNRHRDVHGHKVGRVVK